MQHALTLAKRGWAQTAPNPMVGAVVVRDGAIVGEGHHARFGAPHAEIEALNRAGDLARGATLYVALEPCTHHGKTPPCVPAIVNAGVRRVVIATRDPSTAAGGGVEQLRGSGIDVLVGCEEPAARELNAPFLRSFASDRPWVTVKLAMSIDGAIADAERSRGWITNAASRHRAHELRAGADAVAVGAGTIVADDPQLTVRGVSPPPRVPPLRVVFDRAGRVGPEHNVATTAKDIPTLLFSGGRAHPRASELVEAGVTVVSSSDLGAALRDLRRRGVLSVLVEGGAGLVGSFFEQSLVDRLVIFRAPIVLGAGSLPGFGAVPAAKVPDLRRRRRVEREELDGDVMSVYEITEL